MIIGEQKEVFRHFFAGSLVFLEITYNDSLQQCLTSNKGKAHEKKGSQNRSRN